MKKVKQILMLAAVTMLPAGCNEKPGVPAEPEIKTQTLTLYLEADCGAVQEIQHSDFFVFGAEGVCPLEYHERVDGDAVCNAVYEGKGGDKRVVCIVNCPFPFNTEALVRYDAIEALTLPLADDDPEAPVLTGTKEISTDTDGEAEARIPVTPLLCRIEVSRIINEIGSYTLLEDPVLYLRDISAEVELLRTNGFRQKETGLCSPKLTLAHDIGAFGIEPHAVFWIYPNDSREAGAGTPATSIVLEGTVRGAACSYSVALPPFSRGARMSAALTLEAEGATAEFN